MTVRFLRFTLLARSVFAACYYPDGSVAQDTPCTDGTVQSSCCGTGYACLGHSSSFFLCQATGSEFQKPGATQYVRGSCTDKTWRSANCPNVCVNPDRDNTGGGHGLAQCPLSNTLFYCISTGSGVENCSTGFNLVNLLVKPSILTTIGAAASSTTTTIIYTSTPVISSTDLTSSSVSLSTQVSTPSPAPAGNLEPGATPPALPSSSTNGATIGIAVGVSIGGLGLIAAAVATWLLVRRKRGSEKTPARMTDVQQDPNHHVSTDPPAGWKYPSEVPANEQVTRHELPSSTDCFNPAR